LPSQLAITACQHSTPTHPLIGSVVVPRNNHPTAPTQKNDCFSQGWVHLQNVLCKHEEEKPPFPSKIPEKMPFNQIRLLELADRLDTMIQNSTDSPPPLCTSQMAETVTEMFQLLTVPNRPGCFVFADALDDGCSIQIVSEHRPSRRERTDMVGLVGFLRRGTPGGIQLQVTDMPGGTSNITLHSITRANVHSLATFLLHFVPLVYGSMNKCDCYDRTPETSHLVEMEKVLWSGLLLTAPPPPAPSALPAPTPPPPPPPSEETFVGRMQLFVLKTVLHGVFS
jgi:hypothetical protein